MSLDSPAIAALGGALIHMLWQASLAGLLLALTHLVMRRASAAARYLVDCFALFALPVIFVFTFVGLRYAWLTPLVTAVAVTWLARALPFIVLAWAAGAAALALYSFGGWMLLRRARLAVRATVPAEWLARVESLSARLRVRTPVALGLSDGVKSPCVLGWLRPMILLPVAALGSIAPEQLEALLAHELAHIRRHDYLVNLLQRGVEVALFFHPAVWWISRQVSLERENCCDDAAIAVCGNRLGYARALVDLESWRNQLAVAATGGSLKLRVQRVLGGPRLARRPLLAVGALFLAAASSLMLLGLPAAKPAPVRSLAAVAPRPAFSRLFMNVSLNVVAPARPRPALARRAAMAVPPAAPARLPAAPLAVPALLRTPLAPPSAAATAAPAAAPRTRKLVFFVDRSMIVAFRVTDQQVCSPRLRVTQPLLAAATPLGVPLVGVETVMQCEPVLLPVGAWMGSM